ncbi:hypothetical protein D9R06_00405 [Kocuria marina subsp. indica]|nr:hypothetical protein D9R06_00405 [Kocuria indica]
MIDDAQGIRLGHGVVPMREMSVLVDPNVPAQLGVITDKRLEERKILLMIMNRGHVYVVVDRHGVIFVNKQRKHVRGERVQLSDCSRQLAPKPRVA